MQPEKQNPPLSPALYNTWRQLQPGTRRGVIHSRQMTRRQREQLTRAGYLQPIMRGWYHLRSASNGQPTSVNLMDFLPVYLEERLGQRWCLSAETSLQITFKPANLPKRLVVMAEYGGTTVHTFTSGLRLTIYQDDQQLPTRLDFIDGWRAMTLESILGRLTQAQWQRNLPLVDQALHKINNWESFVWRLSHEERFQALRRLGNRLNDLGLTKPIAIIEDGLRAAGQPRLRTTSQQKRPTAPPPNPNPDLETLWQIWSRNLGPATPLANPKTGTLLNRLSAIEDAMPDDALNHLALSGLRPPKSVIQAYLAAPELAANAAGWPPPDHAAKFSMDQSTDPLPGEVDPLILVAAQGYLDAQSLVKRSIVRLMRGFGVDRILRQDMRGWRLALMRRSAEAGFMTRRQVLRYRDADSAPNLTRDLESWFRLVSHAEPTARRGLLAFLGIMKLRPWQQGNQRLGLLLLNALNAAAGLPWTVLPAEREKQFRQGLTLALDEGDPLPLSNLLAAHSIL